MFEEKISKLLMQRAFSIEQDSVIMLGKVHFVMFPAKAMASLIQKVSLDMGQERLDKIAFNAGEIVAEEFIEKFHWAKKSFPAKLTIILKMFEVMGFGELKSKIWSPKNKKVLMYVKKHPVVDWGKKIYGKKSMICPFYMAIYSAHISKELGIENCWLEETKCVSKGNSFCEWSYGVNKK